MIQKKNMAITTNCDGALIDFQYSSINFLHLQQSKYFLHSYQILNYSFINSNKNKIFK